MPSLGVVDAVELEDILPPPRMAATDECAHRACFRMADVTVIHSVVIRATGSIATDIGAGLNPLSYPPFKRPSLKAIVSPA